VALFLGLEPQALLDAVDVALVHLEGPQLAALGVLVLPHAVDPEIEFPLGIKCNVSFVIFYSQAKARATVSFGISQAKACATVLFGLSQAKACATVLFGLSQAKARATVSFGLSQAKSRATVSFGISQAKACATILH
ncbi:MAG: hypothetical protein R6W90_02800, partial [Ignavibacteriaceae bacterium]